MVAVVMVDNNSIHTRPARQSISSGDSSRSSSSDNNHNVNSIGEQTKDNTATEEHDYKTNGKRSGEKAPGDLP